MRVLVMLVATALSALGEELTIESTRHELILLPTAPATQETALEFVMEPTKHEVRSSDLGDTLANEQGWKLALRQTLGEALSLKQEIRLGLQAENTFRADGLADSHDSLMMLERTVLEWLLIEGWNMQLSAQKQLVTTNSIPFAQIMTYGGESRLLPMRGTKLTSGLEWEQREEFLSGNTERASYRLKIEQELGIKGLNATAGVSLAHGKEVASSPDESFFQKLEAALKWTPQPQTIFTFGAERSGRTGVNGKSELANLFGAKLRQQLFPQSTLELQTGYAASSSSSGSAETGYRAWNIGASTDVKLLENWNAGLGVHFRLQESGLLPTPAEELSLTVSLKALF